MTHERHGIPSRSLSVTVILLKCLETFSEAEVFETISSDLFLSRLRFLKYSRLLLESGFPGEFAEICLITETQQQPQGLK